MAGYFILVTGTLAYFSFRGTGKIAQRFVLQLGGVRWTEEDFCRDWEIDGRTGSGKTADRIVPIIEQALRKTVPQSPSLSPPPTRRPSANWSFRYYTSRILNDCITAL